MRYDRQKFLNDIHSKWVWAEGWVKGSFPDKIGINTLDKDYCIWIDRKRTPYKAKYRRKPETRITFIFQIKEDGIRFVEILGGCAYDDESINLACQVMRELTFEFEKYRIE